MAAQTANFPFKVRRDGIDTEYQEAGCQLLGAPSLLFHPQGRLLGPRGLAKILILGPGGQKLDHLPARRGAAAVEDHPPVLSGKAISFGDNLLAYGWKLIVKRAPNRRCANGGGAWGT